MVFEELVGKKVVYVSGRGHRYDATITGIPRNPGHQYTDMPTVSLEFRDGRGKLIRKTRVLPAGDSYVTQVWEMKE